LLAAFAFVPVSSAIAQAPGSNDQNAIRLNAAQDLSAKQAGLSRAALVEFTRYADAPTVGAVSALTQSRMRRGQTLMIVGGAAFLAGLIIGDDAGTAIAVAGAGIGIYGLYLWAQ
jgi:hypothetical protein